MKRRWMTILSMTVVLILILSCAGTREVAQGPAIIGAEGVVQPAWVVTTPKSADLLYGTGYAKLSLKTTSTKRAVAEAKEKMAQWVNTRVESVLANYTSDMGTKGDRQAVEVFESISRQVSEVSLTEVTQEGRWVDPDGGVWVLLSMPKEQAVQAFAAAQDAFVPSDAAAFAEYKKQEALQLLEHALQELQEENR